IDDFEPSSVAVFIDGCGHAAVNAAARTKLQHPPVVPGGVVSDIRVYQRLDVLNLAVRVPKSEVPDKPVAVCPNVIVLGVEGKHLHEKVWFSGREGGK